MLTDNGFQTEQRAEQRASRREQPSGNMMNQPNNGPKRHSWTKTIVFSLLALVVVIAAYWGYRRHQAAAPKGQTGQQIVPVVTAKVEKKDVPIYLDGLGTAQAFNTVTVHVRVDGELKKVNFTEGQDVKTNDLIAEIDPDPFQAALDQAIGKKGTDEALLANSQADLKREDVLFAAKVDSQQVYDTQKALVDQYAATVKSDQAAITAAQVNLNYTKIYAPINGRTGIRQVDQGNIVHSTDPGGLVVITQLKPISVVFTLPEQNLEQIQKQIAAGNTELKALAVDSDNTTVIDEGTLAVIDNQIDTTTGTLRIKATFPNEKLLLWPGQFVNVRLQLTIQKGALVVPAAAIQRGPDGAYVFIIDGKAQPPAGAGGKGNGKPSGDAANAASAPAGDASSSTPSDGKTNNASGGHGHGGGALFTVKMRNVTVPPQTDAGQVIINSGLNEGDLVVTDGQYKLQDGSTVKIGPANKSGNGDMQTGPKNGIE